MTAAEVKAFKELVLEKSANNFAPVKSIEIIITGPKTEVVLLTKKIVRKAMEALLGPVIK